MITIIKKLHILNIILTIKLEFTATIKLKGNWGNFMKNLAKSFVYSLIFSLVFIIIFGPVSLASKAQKYLPSGIKYEDLPQEIESYVDNNKDTTCGLNVIVYDRDQIIYENYFGYLDKEAGLKTGFDSVYEWGSISKLLVWVSIMQLYEDGKLDINRDIREYLPDGFLKNLSFDKDLTILDLMNHKGGFQDTYFIQTTDASEIKNLEETLSTNQPRQIYEPGVHTAYSNWGAALGALIVERVSGMDYVSYVHKNIFRPLKMNHTTISPKFDDNDWVKNQRKKLKCYDADGRKIDGPGIYYIHLYPAGSAMGTIEDLAKFARALTPDENNFSPLFKNQDTLKEIYTPTSFYGSTTIPKNFHGFFASEYGVETIGHGGNTFGCSAMLQFDPISGVGMVLMTNQAHESIYNYQMYDLVFGKFEDSDLAKIKRDIPKGLILNTRGIIKGPLSFLGALGISSYDKEDLENWWYEENGIVETQFSDFIISTPKAVTNILSMAFFIIAGIYGLLKLIVGGLVIEKIKNKKNSKKIGKLQKNSYILSTLMILSVLNLLIIILRLSNGYRTGDIGSISSYMIQSAIFFVLVILMAYLIFVGFRKYYDEAQKKEKYKYFITSLLAITQILVILSFEMYRFWEI